MYSLAKVGSGHANFVCPKIANSHCDANEFFYSESLAAGSLDQLPAPLEHILADA